MALTSLPRSSGRPVSRAGLPKSERNDVVMEPSSTHAVERFGGCVGQVADLLVAVTIADPQKIVSVGVAVEYLARFRVL